MHYQELHRPTTFEQTASLFQAIHQFIDFAVRCLQHPGAAQAPSFAAEQKEESADDDCDDLKLNTSFSSDDEDLSATEAKPEPSKPASAIDAEPAQSNLTGKQINVAKKNGDTSESYEEPSVSLEVKEQPSTDIDPGEAKQLWLYLLSNAPDKLIEKYPDLLLVYRQKHFLGANDAITFGLKNVNLNNKAIVIRDRNLEKDRFVVELLHHSPPKQVLIKDTNVRSLKPRPICDAFNHFKNDVAEDSWQQMTLNNECFRNETIIYYFLKHQLQQYDGAPSRTNTEYENLIVDAVYEVKSQGLGVTDNDCPKMISFLYSFSLLCKLHVPRLFNIPPHWILRKWKGYIDLYVAVHPGDDVT